MISPLFLFSFSSSSSSSSSSFLFAAQAVFATTDHKPSQPAELGRIVAAGGFVLANRVGGCLAVARALGDHAFKNMEAEPGKQAVSPMPDITFVDRSSSDDEFVLLACDGVYDVVTSEEAVRWIAARLATNSDLDGICQDFVKVSKIKIKIIRKERKERKKIKN
jgi:serine/threonine protein phosphatase PrpC